MPSGASSASVDRCRVMVYWARQSRIFDVWSRSKPLSFFTALGLAYDGNLSIRVRPHSYVTLSMS
jgi:hypothetical protein